MTQRKFFGKALVLLFCFALARHGLALGETQFITTAPESGAFPLCANQKVAPLVVDSNDYAGVLIAAHNLQKDIDRVTGKTPKLFHEAKNSGAQAILIGTIGKSEIVDRLIRDKKINVSDIRNQWESFFLQVVSKPFPGIKSALVICGSDKRGTIYGVYDLSEQIGVSPWYYWADVPFKHHDRLFVRSGKFEQGPPSVKYRGIFLNDEAPDLSGWVRKKFGTVPGMRYVANYGCGFYTNLFELMLRIRANYLWPAMWNNAFNEDDPENAKLANEYGIVMGTSHQEPMLRAQKEWDRKHPHDNWNHYVKTISNPTNLLQQFWRNGVIRNKNFESILTIGARGENDSPLLPGGTTAENMEALSNIINVQSNIIAEELNPNVSNVPQLWCPYKEVLGYYNEGFNVPDYVTILWPDDNWGNLRRLPTQAERQRSGGTGIYYHFDYHGGPRNYQWINTDPIPKIWDQMSLAKQYGADRIWIVNVGHFKGYEFPLEFFMNLAWNTSRWTNTNLDEYTRLWAKREFGSGTGILPVSSEQQYQTHGQDTHASITDEIADIISTYTKYNGRRKPELLNADTYSLVHYDEFEKVVADYNALAAKAEKISEELPPASRNAFYELVLFPVKACAELNAMYLAAAKNELYAKQGRACANDYATKTRELFADQTNLMAYFNHTFAGGKWDHFMDQPYIGYVSWNEPRHNNLDAVDLTIIPVPNAAQMGVTAEGSAVAVTNGEITLPQFDVFNQQRRYIDVFNKGKTPFEFSATPSAPWIHISRSSRGNEAQTKNLETPHVVSYTVKKEDRLWVTLDWNKVPDGTSDGSIQLTGEGNNVIVKITAFKPLKPTRESLHGFVEGDGYVSMEAEHYTKKTDAGANRWIKIPNYGQTLSGMRADGPAYTLATPGKNSPCLEYQMYLFSTGKVNVETTVGPTLNFLPGRPLRYAVSFDDNPPQTITIVPADFTAQNGNREWEESVMNNCRHVQSTHVITRPGYHTLKIWMVDPEVVVEKVVVDCGGVKPSYLGPPESFFNKNLMFSSH